MAVVLALAAAFLFALGSVLQQRAGMDEPDDAKGGGGSGAGLLLRMARRPVWIAGIAADSLGFIGQAVALTIGRLAVVQPLLAASMVFALPLGKRITDQRISRNDVAAAVLVTLALIAFLTIADPSGGRDDAPVGEWLVAGVIGAAVCVPLVLLARRAESGMKAALLGTATGILFGFSAALTKAVGDQFADEVLSIFVNWQLYALIVVGYVSMTLNQLALTTGVLAPALATAMAFDPITSVLIATTLLQESLHESTIGWIATLAALGAVLAGMVILARTSEGAVAVKPGSGSVVEPPSSG